MALIQLPDYTTELDNSEIDENVDPEIPVGKLQAVRASYLYRESFPSKALSQEFFKSVRKWNQRSTKSGEIGQRIYYDCKVQRYDITWETKFKY